MQKILLIVFFTFLAFSAHAGEVYERVIKTNTLRCGYIPYSIEFKVDPNTGEKSGTNYDIAEEIARLLNIKIEWVEELTWATVSTSIQTGRVDALCSGMWIDTQNGKFLAFSQPFYYNSISAYGRVDETRFKKMEDMNKKEIRAVSRDGSTPGIIQRQDFPNMTLISLPAISSDSEGIDHVVTNKADVIFYGDDILQEYMHHNPGKLKSLFPEQPLRVYGTSFAMPIEDIALQNMINNAITELKGSRFIEKTLKKHSPDGAWILSELP